MISKIDSLSKIYKVHKEVKSAILEGKPVIALESTNLCFGISYPLNYETAKEMCAIIRSEGCIPAIIVLMNGLVHVGLDDDELHKMCSTGRKAKKVSTWEMASILAEGGVGATTIASTIVIACKVGIQFFVTGGLGGVHRGGEKTMDISTDLTEIGRNPITVISTGIKSILDIQLTLEYLETLGVAVATLGKSKKFPAFFVPESEFDSPIHLKDIDTAVKFVEAQQNLGIQSGALLAVPIPDEFAEFSAEVKAAIDQAVKESVEQKVEGKENTLFILKRISQITEGKSLQANLAFLKNNSRIGAQLAAKVVRNRNMSL